MTIVVTIAGWLLTGIAVAWLTTPLETNWRPWAPMAAIFGPMWLVIAFERRGARAAESDRPLTHLVE